MSATLGTQQLSLQPWIRSGPHEGRTLLHNLVLRCRATQSGQGRHSGAASAAQHDAAARAACRAALLLAQRYNGWLEQAAAGQALATAWQAVLEVVLVQRWVPGRRTAAQPGRAQQLRFSSGRMCTHGACATG